MFDTVVTIVGNALNTPEWRRLERSHALVAKFKVAANSRRYDKDSGRWVDGASLRVRVNCWRRLAENVASSVLGGDPVIVTGRMYTRDWIGEDGQRRISYELDAAAVGHDLSRGKCTFTRQRPTLGTIVVDDGHSDAWGDEQPTGRAAADAAFEASDPVGVASAPPDRVREPEDDMAADFSAPGDAADPFLAAVLNPGPSSAQAEDQSSTQVEPQEGVQAQPEPGDGSIYDWSELSATAPLVGADRD